MPEKRKLPIESLSKDGIDDRWTESKLAAEGYEYHGEGRCKTCPDTVVFYKKERNYNQRPLWLVVDEGTLERHVCRGGRR